MSLEILGSSFAGRYKRMNDYPIDITEVWNTKNEAIAYAQNIDAEPYAPYAGQIISVLDSGEIFKLVKHKDIPETDGKKHFDLELINSKNDNDNRYVRKDIAETIRFLMTFLEGVNVKGVSTLEEIKLLKNIVSQNFSNGSTGLGIFQDEQGNYHLDIDFVNIRRKLTVEEIQVQRTYYVAGKQYNTSGGGIICSAVEDIGTAWRCRFKTTDADGRTVHCTFEKGDQAICQTFNLVKKEEGKLGNRYYWRLVVDKGDDFIDLLKTDCGSGSDIPRAGDEIVQLGNRSDVTRQGANVLDSVTFGGPYIRIYQGINSYHLPLPKIDLNPTESIIKAKFISEATGKDIDSTLDDMKVNLDLIKSQTDKEYTLWFFDYAPTLTNRPTSEWTTDALKTMHEQDMFYNRTTGLAYRFEKSDSTWVWNNITDQQTIKALDKASDAQDTADGKKRVFVAQPTTVDTYDVGDMWVNATYPSSEPFTYQNDSLVCKTAKESGIVFNIDHWEPTTRFTTAEIINLGNEILQKVSINKTDIDKAMAATDNVVKQITAELGGVNESAAKSASYILHTKDKIASVVANFDDNGNVTNSSGLVTTGNMASMFSQYVDPDGNIVKKADIETFVKKNADGTLESGVKIEADKINFIGKTIINGKFIVDEAGNLTLNDIEANNLKLSGNISGTNATLNDITLNNITANSGKIGNFEIGYGRIGIQADPDGASTNGMFLYNNMIGFNDGKRQSIIGVWDSLSSEILARFSDTESTDFSYKTGILIDIAGAKIDDGDSSFGNNAIRIARGNVCGLRRRTRRISTGKVLSKYDSIVMCVNTGEITVTLPPNPEDGQEIWMCSSNQKRVSVTTSDGTRISTSGGSFASFRWHIYIYDAHNRVWIYSYTNND